MIAERETQGQAQHTPGPWADWHRDDGAFHIGTAEPVYVCRMIGGDRDPEVVANARLIAAAPDLAEALADLVWAVNEGRGVKRALEAAYAAQEKAGLI